jgi:hypothetical protein
MRGEVRFSQAGSPKGFEEAGGLAGVEFETTCLSRRTWLVKPATASTAPSSPNLEKARSTLSTAGWIGPLSNYPGRLTLHKAQRRCFRRRLL